MKYKIIYADPPWQYRDKRDKHPRICGGARSHYSTMPLEDIKKLPIESISDDNAMLFLWATFPMLKEALEVIEAWGFTYKTLGFSWIKTYPNGKPFFGIGWYTKSNAEVCLIGIRGKPWKASNSVSSVIISTKGKHSEKPPEVREKIVQFLGDVPRIELFAREVIDGWDRWGNQVPSSLEVA